MVAAETLPNTPRGWLAVLRGGQPSMPVRHWAPQLPDADEPISPQAAAMLVALELTEERMRAATSGFEMGEYEPLARRS